jgi:hypothetical protein
MAKKHKKKEDYHAPSDVLLAARLQSGAGKHGETRKERDERTGRLRGAEKRRLMEEY